MKILSCLLLSIKFSVDFMLSTADYSKFVFALLCLEEQMHSSENKELGCLLCTTECCTTQKYRTMM